MLATVSQTRSLEGSFYYDRALNKQEKGGHVIASSGIPQYSSAKIQLAYMQAYCSDKYQVKAINIVLSHSSEDKDILLEHPEKKGKYVNDFLDECKSRGIDLNHVPWIIMEHVNTDCDHYHMIVLITKFDGSRLDTGFIGKKAAKAAWAASKKNGLHFAKGIEKREEARLKFVREQFGEEKVYSAGLSIQDLEKLKETTSKNRTIKKKAELERRAKSAAEATERRNYVKMVIEETAKNSFSMASFIKEVSQHGISFGEENGVYTATINNGKRDVTYKIFRLGVDVSLIETVKQREAEEKRKEEEVKAQQKEERKKKEQQRKEEEAMKEEKESRSRGWRHRW